MNFRILSIWYGLAGLSALAADLYVSPSGNDTNPGTRTAALQTLGAARDAARKFAGREPVTIHVAPGVYYLPDKLVFGPADSGTAQNPIIYQSEREGAAIISGGLKLALKWTAWRDGIFQASTPAGLVIDRVFVNGQCQRMARYPNYDPGQLTAAYQGYSADAFSKERAARWADPAGGYIHAMHVHRWGGYHYRITGKQPDGNVTYEGGWQNNRQMGMHKEFRMVENIFEELDAPGEWFHDAKAGVLYFKPDPDTDLGNATVEVVRLRHLVEFQGSAASPVRHITLQGFSFRHAARTFMDNKEPLLRSDWTIYRGGALLLTGTEDVRIRDCEFDQPGGNAIFVNNYNRRTLIKGCHIHDTGASGICFVGDPAAVRNPLFEYGQSQPLAKIDRTPGPKTDNYPADMVVEDCLIHGIGRVERQPAGVQISMASRVTVRDTSIYDCVRAGINIGDGCWGGHLIERCDVFDTVLETHDHGSFNSWGRDRYWTSNHRGVSQPEVNKDPRLPFLDAVAPVVIRDSRWRCDHGWDIDLDDGSSNYEIYNNLLLRGGLKFREGYVRKAFNNILINSGFHPHVWFDHSDSAFYQNIVMAAHAGIGQPENWGEKVDRNFFTSQADRSRNLGAGADAHSLVGDPLFVDPQTGDFRVKPASAALQVGFTNFPMDQLGVKKAALQRLARTPVIPPLKTPAKTPAAGAAVGTVFWLGAPLHELRGEEFSAFGVGKEDGGVQLVEVPAGSAAEQAGLKKNDLLQQLNGHRIVTTADLFKALAVLGDSPLRAVVVRNQKAETLSLPATPFLALETAGQAVAFERLVPRATPRGIVTARPTTQNEPLTELLDGRLAQNYGPVFANDVRDGCYRVDLGSAKPVRAITSWSFNQNGNRGRQCLTLFGSNSATDPGWNPADSTRFIPLCTIDTTSLPSGEFQATSWRAWAGESLGTFRWILWRVNPVTALGENTSFQELTVETVP
jgi:hypothetical protein